MAMCVHNIRHDNVPDETERQVVVRQPHITKTSQLSSQYSMRLIIITKHLLVKRRKKKYEKRNLWISTLYSSWCIRQVIKRTRFCVLWFNLAALPSNEQFSQSRCDITSWRVVFYVQYARNDSLLAGTFCFLTFKLVFFKLMGVLLFAKHSLWSFLAELLFFYIK